MHRGLTRVDNLGDLTAKAGAQGTFASLVGTGLGIALSMTLGTSPSTLITAFVPLCAINLFCAYRINMSVVTRVKSEERECERNSRETLAPSHSASPPFRLLMLKEQNCCSNLSVITLRVVDQM